MCLARDQPGNQDHDAVSAYRHEQGEQLVLLVAVVSDVDKSLPEEI